jgi:RhoGEF domain
VRSFGAPRQTLNAHNRHCIAAWTRAHAPQFLKAAPFFKMYGTFVRNFGASRETLNALEARPAVAVFLKACELQRACRGLTLRDLLM